MGIVYRVMDKRLNRQAALKTLPPAQVNESTAERFLQEAELTAHLDHPNIPPIYEMGQTGLGEYYILMRLVEGRDLSEKIQEYHEDQRSELLTALLGDLVKVCEAVAYAHGQGILHRDLKPDNIRVGG
ncbi:MAG: protein kinase, partial [Planctomycetota bacterium]|nr:protein kinase [Planctomycetota bacterium]